VTKLTLAASSEHKTSQIKKQMTPNFCQRLAEQSDVAELNIWLNSLAKLRRLPNFCLSVFQTSRHS